MDAITMPQVGQDIPAGTIVEWKKKVGDPVAKGEVVLIVESEKAVFDVEAPAAGVLLAILFQPEQEAKVLEPVGYVGQPGERIDAPAAPAVAPTATTTPAGTPCPCQATPAPSERPKSSPAARRVARERGLDVAAMSGSGPGGRVVKRDVLAAKKAVVSLSEDREVVFDRLRKTIADRLTKAVNEIPHFSLTLDVDMAAALAWRAAANAEGSVKVSINDLVLKAVADALIEFPNLNSHVAADRMVIKAAVNLGIAVGRDEGLVVPVLAEVGGKDVFAIARESRALIEAARAGQVRRNAPGTFTVTNLGGSGVREFRPIVNPPECAILAVGAVEDRVVARDGMIAVRPMMTVTLACDHRGVDGAYAARFLARFRDFMQAAAF